MPYNLHRVQAKFVYEGHGINVKVTEAKRSQMTAHALFNTGRQFSSVLARWRHSRVVPP